MENVIADTERREGSERPKTKKGTRLIPFFEDFVWSRPTGPLRWEPAGSPRLLSEWSSPGCWLVADEGTEFEAYSPMEEHPRLYEQFAGLAGNPARVPTFASDYGLLVSNPRLLETRNPNVDLMGVWGQENQATWESESRAMSQALELRRLVREWKATSDADRKASKASRKATEAEVKLKRAVVWNPSGQASGVWFDGSALDSEWSFGMRDVPAEYLLHVPRLGAAIASPGYNDTHLGVWKKSGELCGPAREFLARGIAERLRDAVHVRIRIDVDTAGRFVPGISVTPRTLLGALWVQLFQDVIGQRRFAQCSYCQRIYVVHRDPRWVTCSEACMGGRDRVLRDDRDGLSEGEIARKRSLSIDVVQKILATHRTA